MSIATMSCIYCRSSHVREFTRLKGLEVSQRLNDIPGVSARSLASGGPTSWASIQADLSACIGLAMPAMQVRAVRKAGMISISAPRLCIPMRFCGGPTGLLGYASGCALR